MQILAAPFAGTIAGDYESIQTVTVGAGGQASIEFAAISSTYKHLQIRGFSRTNRGTYGVDSILMRLNSDTAANYSKHALYGDASTAYSVSDLTSTGIDISANTSTTVPTTTFGVMIVDILDYANTNKYKTVRVFGGVDTNGSIGGVNGRVGLLSGSWRNSNAVATITMTPIYGTSFAQYTQFALYGIKG
jgi:hypothetical protein